MSTQSISLSGYITIGLALIQGMTQEKAIASNAALNQQQKNEQMATVAAQQLGKMLSSVPEIPKEIVTLVEDAQLDEKIIEAGEALVGLVKEFAPKPPEAPKPPTAV